MDSATYIGKNDQASYRRCGDALFGYWLEQIGMDFDVVQSGRSLARSFFKLAAARRRQYGVTLLYAAPPGGRRANRLPAVGKATTLMIARMVLQADRFFSQFAREH